MADDMYVIVFIVCCKNTYSSFLFARHKK